MIRSIKLVKGMVMRGIFGWMKRKQERIKYKRSKNHFRKSGYERNKGRLSEKRERNKRRNNQRY